MKNKTLEGFEPAVAGGGGGASGIKSMIMITGSRMCPTARDELEPMTCALSSRS